uniref:BED-type domain-containing protein n=1 Tax=Rhizophagus irregularis (strain DAOM 181602 / DAOM 197198 / MUCL 43194) TaxID=747089 RepID=U9UI28_RHIID
MKQLGKKISHGLLNILGNFRKLSDTTCSREKKDLNDFVTMFHTRKFIPVRAPSVVWQYFEKLYDDNGVHSQSRCNFCGKNYSAGCATSTLNYHWECKHKHSKVQPGGTRSIEMAFNNSEKQVKSKGGEHLGSSEK